MTQTILRFALAVTALAVATERTLAIPAQQPDQILRSSDSSELGQYGHSLALHGDRMIVGSIGSSGASEYSGAAYILERSSTLSDFVEVKKVWNVEPGLYQFGWRVALHDDVAAAISQFHSTPPQPVSGSNGILVYERNNLGEWAEADQLFPSDGHPADGFGTSLSAGENTLIAGASLKRGDNFGEGAAYIFERSALGGWSETAKLTASNASQDDHFGYSASVDSGFSVVGAPRSANGELGPRSGSAYVFKRDAVGNWTEQVELKPSDPMLSDGFGFSVAISGDTIVVGAPGHSENGQFSGAAYIFQRTNDQWLETAKLTFLGPPFRRPPGFGQSVDIDNGLIVVAGGASSSGSDGRVIMTYEESAMGEWKEMALLKADNFFQQGNSIMPVSVSGGTVAIADYFSPDGDRQDVGAALVFQQVVPEPSSLGCWFLAVVILASRRRGYSFASWQA